MPLRCLSCGREKGDGPNGVETISLGSNEYCSVCSRLTPETTGHVGPGFDGPGLMSEREFDRFLTFTDCYDFSPKQRITTPDAKREILRSWEMWDGDKSDEEEAPHMFYYWLEVHRPYFLTFPKPWRGNTKPRLYIERREAMREWVTEHERKRWTNERR